MCAQNENRIQVCRMGLNETTQDGPYYAKVDGEIIGLNGKTHFANGERARLAAESFIILQDKFNTREQQTMDSMSWGIQLLCNKAHANSKNAGWWHDLAGEPLLDNEGYAPYVVATKLQLLS